MKKINIINGLFTVLLLSGAVVQADEKYPAADFQPSVVYQDNDYIAKSGQSAASSTSAAASHQADSKYPAANFEPKVVYNDPGYKHSSSSPASSMNASGSVSASESSSASSADKKAEDSSSSFLIGLVLFAVVGYVFLKKRPEAKSQTSSRVYGNDGSGMTGVAKYLNRKSGTGVARYLEKQVKTASATAATGVAKYMAKHAGSSETTKAAAKTGVEKYLRNRG